VYGDYRQSDLFPCQQYLQLARSPVRPLLPKFDHTLFDLYRRLPRTVQRTPTLLRHARDPADFITPQPLVTGRPRNLELLAGLAHRRSRPTRPHHETHPLIIDVHGSPSHPRPLPRARYLLNPSATHFAECKGCPDNVL